MDYQLTPASEIKNRIARFQALLRESSLDGAMITQNVDLFYFSGTVQRSRLFIPVQGEPVLAVQGNLERALQESSLGQVIPLKESRQFAGTLAGFNYAVCSKVGLEMDVLPARFYLALQKEFPQADFQDVSELIKTVRMVKSDYEVAQVRKGCEILNRVMNEAQSRIRPGMAELEVDAFLTALARGLGHQGLIRMRGYNQEMFSAHVLSGRNSAVPTFLAAPLGGPGTTPAIAQGASHSAIAENQPIIIDFGVGINGYVTDMTRTFVIGRLSPELQEAYDFALSVKRFMEGWVKPGRLCSSLYEEVLRLARDSGYQDNFMGWRGGGQVSFAGHGIGLEIDEYPVVAASFRREFEENMVFAFEPKLVFPGVGAVGVEDDYLVTSTGVERLTTYSDELLTVTYS